MNTLSRRELLKRGGAIVVSFAASTGLVAQNGPAATAHDVDSFLAIHEDGTVTVFTSKVDVGTGITTAYRQIASEELGIPVENCSVIQGDTATVPSHGGTGGSSGVPRGGVDIRLVAATARQALLEKASVKLNRPVTELTIVGGQLRSTAGGSVVSIASLMGGQHFNLKVNPKAPLRDPATYVVVGKPILRTEIPAKCTGRHVYVQDVRVANMLHGRVIRPAAIGAQLLSVDESSIQHIPDVRVVRVESFLGVVAKNEWAAIRAARELKVAWSEGQPLPVSAGLDRAMREAPSERDHAAMENGDAAANLTSASKQLSATYYWPFQSHASLGPSCAIADVKESATTIWSSTQDTYGLRSLVARVFNISAATIRVIYLEGSGSYGSNGAYDCAADAVLLSRAAGSPVRLQWMRHDEHAWDPKGPAQVLEVRGGIDQAGNIVAWNAQASAVGGPQWTTALLGPTSAGIKPQAERGGGDPVTQNLDPPYAVSNVRVTTRLLKNTPIRLSNLRAPGKMGTMFATESFTDELASAAGLDAVAFRRRTLNDPRALAVIDRAASMIDWQPRPSPKPRLPQAGDQYLGRGFAYLHYKQAETYVGMAIEVAVDRATGRLTVRHVACAHDCGLIINPDGLRNQVEGNIMQALSRTLHEEVTFDGLHVTSRDWASYPILSFPEAPVVDVALLDHPNQPAYGAGEAAGTAVPAALANAIFDATGVRLRNVPFTAASIRTALASVI